MCTSNTFVAPFLYCYFSVTYCSISSSFIIENPITDDILATVLSLYMQDTSPSLPSSEEVVICSSDTTAEEVSIFDLQMNSNNV